MTIMTRKNRTPLFMCLCTLFYLILLFSPLAFIQTVSAEQDPVQETYGTGKTLVLAIDISRFK